MQCPNLDTLGVLCRSVEARLVTAHVYAEPGRRDRCDAALAEARPDAEALARFADRRSVRDSLVSSLSIQTEPIVQVVLINLLAEKRETRAIAPIRNIINNKKKHSKQKDGDDHHRSCCLDFLA